MDIYGGAGADVLKGRASDDLIYGFEGDDTLLGQGGHDVLAAHEGDDSLSGGAGDDYLLGGLGDDTIHGGGGVDWAAYEDATGAVAVDLRVSGLQHTGGAGVDKLIGIENHYGSAFNDHLFGNDAQNYLSGGAGDDTIYGHGGDDHLDGGAGSDRLDGGEGYDVVSYDNSLSVDISLEDGRAFSVDLVNGSSLYVGGTDTISGIEDFYGSQGEDYIRGNVEDNFIYGRGGADYLSGGRGGNDLLDGGEGDDLLEIHASGGTQILIGGSGRDGVSFSEAEWGSDGVGVVVDLKELGPQELYPGVTIFIDSIEIAIGSNGSDTLFGNESANEFFLAAGDIVVYRSLSEIGVGETSDTISNLGYGVQVDVSSVDANVLVEGNQEFSYLGSDEFSGAGGEIILRSDAYGAMWLEFDVNGDSIADAQLWTSSPLLEADFLIL